jgi:hypothetical protein
VFRKANQYIKQSNTEPNGCEETTSRNTNVSYNSIRSLRGVLDTTLCDKVCQ